jgi:hypothetical protein
VVSRIANHARVTGTSVSRLRNLVGALRPSALARHGAAFDHLSDAVAALRSELADARTCMNTLTTHVAEVRGRAEAMLATHREDLHERLRIADLSGARLLSDSVTLEGSPGARLRVRRRAVGEPVERTFSRWMGVTRCASTDPHVRAAWERLMASEANSDGMLRGAPSTILDVPDAVVSMTHTPATRAPLRVSIREGHAATPDHAVLAVPKFTHDFPLRKRDNFGHWLLDCVPQVVALMTVAPDAVFLLPSPLKGFQRAVLLLVGLTDRQIVPWDGTPVRGGRVVVFESDGRAGGGRPLSALMQMRGIVSPDSVVPGSAAQPGVHVSAPLDRGERRHGRRLYVSRRDAKPKRRWVSNEPDVERLFESRGFEIVNMADCSLDEQVRMFRDASIVAGVSGAGLADVAFSAPGTQVIVLLSDGLMRWYADETGARSLWASDQAGTRSQLAALGDSPRFYAHLAAAFEQVCHTFVGEDALPLDHLSSFLDDVLGQADGA